MIYLRRHHSANREIFSFFLFFRFWFGLFCFVFFESNILSEFCTLPQMIPKMHRKLSSTANDPERKIKMAWTRLDHSVFFIITTKSIKPMD